MGVAVATPAGVFVTVGVEVGVNVGPPGVTVTVTVEVGVGVKVGPPGVKVAVGVEVGVRVAVWVGVGVAPIPLTVRQAENSDVPLPGFVAVAVAKRRGVAVGKFTPNAIFPVPSVVRINVPIGV